MNKLSKALRFADTHEWVHVDENNIATVGISDHAQASLGDIVFVELPALKKKVKKGDEICVLESVKAAADVYAPLSGEITEINLALTETPELINSDSYNAGWLFRIKITDANELKDLLTAEQYEQLSVETH
ncbi:MAG: glycine cleavage system protein GcvH [Rickettsiella sp.]|nr:glycine cleavage system protein GcvH [Rickettsiella sp.]